MSKKRRRNSRRRKSSSCTKQSQSPYTFQQQNESPSNSVVYENDRVEKGESDSLRKESFYVDSDDGEDKEQEIPSKEKKFRMDSREGAFHYETISSNHSEAEGTNKGVRITTSVTINDCKLSTSRILFQQSRDIADRKQAQRSISVTTTKVKRSGSKVEVEISEVLRSDDSDIKTTFVVQNKKGRRKGIKSRQDSRASPNNENLTRSYSVNHNETTMCENYKQCESKNYKFSISEINTDFNKVGKEDGVCCKSCCENRLYGHCACSHNDYVLTEGYSSLSTLSDTCLETMEQSLPNTASTEVFSDIPPPQGFADREYDLLDELSEDIASCQISSSDKFEHQEGGAASGLAQSEDMGNNPDSGCPYSPESSVNRAAFLECLSASDTYDSLFLVPRMPVSRSSYTKEFINNHDGTRRLRNNSIAILETKPRTPCGFEKQAKRRQTFPGPTDYPSKMPEGMPNFRESFSSGTLSSFFLQSLPLQAERVGRFYMDDERSFPFSAESRKSSESSTSNKASSGNFTGYRTYLSNISAYGNNRNPFYPSGAGESQEEVSVAGQHAQRRKVSNEVPVAVPEISPVVNSCMNTPDHGSFGNGHLEHSEVAESGFDEEMVEAEELNREFYADELTQRNLFIHVTPPSPSNSEELIIENSGCQLANLGENSTIHKPHVQETTAGAETPPKRRRGSVMTIIIGGSEQRSIQNDAKPLEAPEGSQRNVCSGISEAPSVSPVQDIDEVEADANSDAFEEEKTSPQRTIATESSASSQIFTQDNEMREASGKPAESQGGTENGPLSQQNGCHGMDDKVMTEDRVSATNGSQDSGTTDTKPKLQQTDSIERRSIPRSPTELKIEAKEHLRPPADPILKDQEDVPDHWAKRRKLFKESKQWSSAGGSSLTSNITEESVNSEDGRSVDISVRDIEDRGFYTETFHSASWIYRGDDIHPSDSPRCLSNRPRPVTIRERTVRISKGIGEYPWGFRIQFSKPIVVTEVDTNGAAEEAGLLVGDSVLAVNGTDVTSVPHSEAADLARQGPDILTLTIGSDISRCPNTPRPACRGYLHKRTQSGLLKGWRKRWFVLKHDCCLYYYRHKRDEGKHRALSSMKLEGAEVGSDTSLGKPFVFKCNPVSCARVYYFCATSNQEMKRWLEAMERAIHPITQNHVWIDVTRHNSNLPPLAIKNPECLGLLHQMDKSKDVWVQHYCILKDGCLYFYAGIRSTHAMGGIFLHGYTVREQPYGSRRSTIELKPPSEEFKTFHLCAENATENKRWILALKASISKWLLLHQAIEDYMNRPSEETRM